MPRERQEIVLKKAGYYYHPTHGQDGLTEYGYIRQIEHKIRWHALLSDNWLNIHQDRTNKYGFHRTVTARGMEEQEKIRLCVLYREMFPRKEDPHAMKIKGRGEFAPNLRELQKNHKTALQSQEIEPSVDEQENEDLSTVSAC